MEGGASPVGQFSFIGGVLLKPHKTLKATSIPITALAAKSGSPLLFAAGGARSRSILPAALPPCTPLLGIPSFFQGML